MVSTKILYSCIFRLKIHAVGTAPQSDLPQGRQVFNRKRSLSSQLGLSGYMDIARSHSFDQFLRFNVNQLHLPGIVKNRIRDSFTHRDTRNGRYSIV